MHVAVVSITGEIISDAVSPQIAPYAVEYEQVEPTSGAPVVKVPTNLSTMGLSRGLGSRQSLLRRRFQEDVLLRLQKTESVALCDGFHNR